jgi:hypothetical protein
MPASAWMAKTEQSRMTHDASHRPCSKLLWGSAKSASRWPGRRWAFNRDLPEIRRFFDIPV